MFGVSGARAQGRRPESKLGVFGAQHKLKNSQNLTSVGRQWELERGRFGGFRKPEKATQAGRAVILKPSFVALTPLSESCMLHFRPGNTPWGSSAFPVFKVWLKRFPTSLPKKYRRHLWESLQVREELPWRTSRRAKQLCGPLPGLWRSPSAF